MNFNITQKREQLTSLCKSNHVRALHLFGSGTTVDFDDVHSDLDFTIEFLPMTPSRRAEAYFGMLEGLEELFSRNIDLVVYSTIENPYFRESIDSSRVQIYAAA